MKTTRLAFFALAVLVLAATTARAQETYYCVKPDGTPVCAISVQAQTGFDPSALCNKASPQCALACAAVGGAGAQEKYGPMGLPLIPVTREMVTGQAMTSQPESAEYCRAQFDACMTRCRSDPFNVQSPSFMEQCFASCQSVFSGCGKGNREN